MGPAGVGLEGVAVIAGVKLEPEAIANGEESVQGAVVADSPGGEDGEESEQRDDAVAEPWATDLADLEESDEEKEGKRDRDGRIR